MRHCKRGHPQTEENIVRNKQGRIKDCKACVRIRAAEWYKNNPEKANEYGRTAYAKNKEKFKRRFRDRTLKVKYGLTRTEYEALFEQQNFKCGNRGCQRKIDKSASHLDHDHSTGALRGLLCKQCNWALGMVQDNLQVIRGLAAYLEEKRLDES